MDRFIEDVMVTVTDYILNLKSNMDRFIVFQKMQLNALKLNLKSNMDRFIGNVKQHIYFRCSI